MNEDDKVIHSDDVKAQAREERRDEAGRAQMYELATKSWEEEKMASEKSWSRYRNIGNAMVEARGDIMHKLGSNKPRGKGYQNRMMQWLKEHRLDDMHKTTRSLLCTLIDNIIEIEEMMQSWTPGQHAAWAAPNTVYAQWKEWKRAEQKKSGEPTKSQRRNLSKAKQTSDELAVQIQLNDKLEKEVKSLREAKTGGDLKALDAGQIVDLIEELPVSKKNAVLHDLDRSAAEMPTDLNALRSAYIKAFKAKVSTAKSEAEKKRFRKEEEKAFTAAFKAAEVEPTTEEAEVEPTKAKAKSKKPKAKEAKAKAKSKKTKATDAATDQLIV